MAATISNSVEWAKMAFVLGWANQTTDFYMKSVTIDQTYKPNIFNKDFPIIELLFRKFVFRKYSSFYVW